MALILVVAMRAEHRTGLDLALRRAGFEMVAAHDADEAMARLREMRPALVLCGSGMSRMTGGSLRARVIREMPEHRLVPFLFSDAGTTDEGTAEAEEFVRAGDLEREREDFATLFEERARRSFLAAAEALNHLAEGVVLLDGAGTAVFINRVGQRILAEEDGLVLRRGRLGGARSGESRRVQGLVDAALAAAMAASVQRPPAPLVLARPSGRKPLVLRVRRLDGGSDGGPDFAAAALFISDLDARPQPSEPLLVALHDFTLTEARIVAQLIQGLSVGEIAEAQEISRNTIHHHLKSIFRKTGATRQSELISQILSGPIFEL